MKTARIERTPHDREWQLQEAKNRLSQVVDLALNDGPQTITLRGKPAVMVVSYDEFKKLTQPQSSLSRFFEDSPLYGVELDLNRRADLPREVDL